MDAKEIEEYFKNTCTRYGLAEAGYKFYKIEEVLKATEKLVLSLTESSPKEEEKEDYIMIGTTKINLRGIKDVYDIERDKQMFLNREAGFIIEYENGSEQRYGENIPYESYPHEIRSKKQKWKITETKVFNAWQEFLTP